MSSIAAVSVVNVSDWSLTVTAGGKGPGCAVLLGIVVQYILLYIMVVMGASLTFLFNGPTSCNVAGYVFG